MIEAFAITGWLVAFFFLAWALRLAWVVRQQRSWAERILRGGARPSREIARMIVEGRPFSKWEQPR